MFIKILVGIKFVFVFFLHKFTIWGWNRFKHKRSISIYIMSESTFNTLYFYTLVFSTQASTLAWECIKGSTVGPWDELNGPHRWVVFKGTWISQPLLVTNLNINVFSKFLKSRNLRIVWIVYFFQQWFKIAIGDKSKRRSLILITIFD